MNFPLLKNKKLYYLIALLITISTVSIISIYFIIQNAPDNIPPDVSISQPAEGVTVSGTQSIVFSASDQQGFITERQILIDGLIVQSSSYSHAWDTTQETDGSHVILCRAKDKTVWGGDDIIVFVNNSGLPDEIPPNVSIIFPAANSIVSDVVIIEMDATDENGISSQAVYIDEILVSVQPSYYWDTTQEIDGPHDIFCEARDPSNNLGNDTISIIVNNSQAIQTPPVIFKIMEFNINSSGQYSDWKEVVKEENADIIMFIETGYWDNSGNDPLNQYIDEFNAYFTEEDPYVGYCAQDIWYWADGAAILSRYPIMSFNQISQVSLDNATLFNVTHDFLDIEVIVSGTLIHVIGSHLKAFDDQKKTRELEQEGIINYMDSLGSLPIVYLADMNSFSPEDWGLNTIQSGLGYGPLSMMVPPYINPETDIDYNTYSSTIHSWTDVYRTLNPNEWGITNPEWDSRIDFIFVNQFLASNIVNSTTGNTDHASSGSDHFTVDAFIAIEE